jgi:hypothetical protein
LDHGAPAETDVKGALVAKRTQSAEEKDAKEKAARGRRLWKLLSTGAALAAGMAMTKALETLWRTATGHKPPAKPENPAIARREALLWAAVSGMAIGLAKTYATRRAAMYWVRSFGDVPPGMEEADKDDQKELKRLAREKS